MRLGKVDIRPELPRNKQVGGFDVSTIHCFLDKLPQIIGRSRQTAPCTASSLNDCCPGSLSAFSCWNYIHSESVAADAAASGVVWPIQLSGLMM
jgi:hypothetical protein